MAGAPVELPFIGDKTWNRVERYLDVRPNRRPRHKDVYFHASGIKGMCPILEFWGRRWVEQAKKKRGKKREELLERVRAYAYNHRFSGTTQAILDTGTVLHKQVQFYYGVTGLLVGAWRCPVCGHVEKANEPIQMPRVAVASATGYKIHDFAECPECRKNYYTWPHWEYVEPHALERTEMIGGSTDGLLDYKYSGQIYKGLLEVKTINENGFEEKYGDPLPQPHHVYQASLYMHLFGRRWALILYMNKNRSTVKEFIVPKDPGAWDHAVRKARAVRQAMKRKRPPAADWRVCSSIKDKVARACAACEECWGRKAPENFIAS